MTNLAVFASGSGTNFQKMIEAIETGDLDAKIVLLVSDRKDAFAIQRAQQADIPVFAFSPKDYANKQAFEEAILQELNSRNVEWIVLAGYMRLIGKTLLEAYPQRILNIHPSLLPAFPGLDAIGQAFAAGVKIAGITIHYVDAGMDTGSIIAQEAVRVETHDTRESLEAKIHQMEHQLYPKTLQQIIKGR